QTIIKQGDDDGYYYIVKRGKCRVTRKPSVNAAEIEVAILGVGAGFGEEALIMREPRSATITMTENGQLMRLSRADFTRLLAEPLVQIVSYKDVVKNPKNVFVDVRSYDEYVQNGISNSEHSPLAEMRAKIHTFDSHKQYVMVSGEGGRASAAAFLLCQQGLDAVVLNRGLSGVPDDVARGNGDVDELANIPVIDNVVDFHKLPQQETGTQAIVEVFDVYADYDQLEDQLEELNVSNLNVSKKADKPSQLAKEPKKEPKAEVAESVSEANEKLINDPRVNAIFARAKERVVQEARKAKIAEQARKKAEQGLEKLKREAEQAKVEAEKARKQVETASHQSAEVARLEAIKEAARLREVELGCKQAEVEEAIRQAEEEARRAHASETAYREAQEENARLKREMEVALERTKEESRKSVEALKLFAEQEERHFKKMAKRRAREEEKIAREVEKARVNAEKKLKTLQGKAAKINAELEKQADAFEADGKSQAEQEIIQQKIEILMEEQHQVESSIRQVALNIEHAEKAQAARVEAVAKLEEIRLDAEHVRAEAARFACIAADNSHSQEEQASAHKNAKKLAEKQLLLEESIREAEAEIARKQAIEDARRAAEEEIQQIREKAAIEKARIEQRALKIADEARKEAEKQAEKMRAMELAAKQAEIDSAEKKAFEEAQRARQAEEARLKAEAEIEKLRQDAEQARIDLEKQLSADIKRSEIEHEVARVRAEELVNKQNEIDEISKATEQASLRAMAAEEAKLNAEQEIERLKAEIAQARATQESTGSTSGNKQLEIDEAELLRKQQEILEIGRTLEKEAKRVQAAEAAQIEAQEEIARLRSEVESLTRQAQKQLTDDVQRSAVENASVRQQAEELNQKQRLVEEAIQQAQHQAQMAKEAIEAKAMAEADARRLKAQSDMALLQAREMVRKSKEEARELFQREIEQARAEEAALREAEIKEAIRKTKLESKRAEAAEKARLAAEREIERLKVAAEVRRIKAEKAIKESIKTASQSADSTIIGYQNRRHSTNSQSNQQVVARKSSGVDFFQYEPPTDLEVQDDMSLLFTNIDVGDQPAGAMDQIKAMSNEPKKSDDESEEELDSKVSSSAWVSDQVMWEATLGIREDEKAQAAIQPVESDSYPAQNYRQDSIQARQMRKPGQQEKEESSDRSLFKGRDINPYAVKQAAVIPTIPRRQIKAWLKKGKILLWLSPLIVAIAYYFTLSEDDQIALQLNISKSVSGMFGGSDISQDAKKLIEETEARIAKENQANTVEKTSKGKTTTQTKSAKTRASVVEKTVANPENEIRKAPQVTQETVKTAPKSFAGKDIPFNDEPASRPVVSAPLPGTVSQGQPVLPPLPDTTSAKQAPAATVQTAPQATATATKEVITSVDGVAVGRVINNPTPAPEGKKPVVGRTSIGELPPASFDASDPGVDVNAEQNSATFQKSDSTNLETPIAK
ncbi:cyclic nucleotide-binding domain-containing protein, partial [Kaarinaea lacus]